MAHRSLSRKPQITKNGTAPIDAAVSNGVFQRLPVPSREFRLALYMVNCLEESSEAIHEIEGGDTVVIDKLIQHIQETTKIAWELIQSIQIAELSASTTPIEQMV